MDHETKTKAGFHTRYHSFLCNFFFYTFYKRSLSDASQYSRVLWDWLATMDICL